MVWLYHQFFSTTNAWYGFWSGFGSDIAEFALVGAIWHKLNCHETGCWRIGLHPHEHLMLCRHHHPRTRACP